jgi:hypothetical protein
MEHDVAHELRVLGEFRRWIGRGADAAPDPEQRFRSHRFDRRDHAVGGFEMIARWVFRIRTHVREYRELIAAGGNGHGHGHVRSAPKLGINVSRPELIVGAYEIDSRGAIVRRDVHPGGLGIARTTRGKLSRRRAVDTAERPQRAHSDSRVHGDFAQALVISAGGQRAHANA